MGLDVSARASAWAERHRIQAEAQSRASQCLEVPALSTSFCDCGVDLGFVVIVGFRKSRLSNAKVHTYTCMDVGVLQK